MTNEYTVEGPIAYVETTTLNPEAIFPEDLNRALQLGTDETPEQTRAILASYAGRYAEKRPPVDTEAIVTRHREFQARLQQRAVVIQFAPALMAKIPAQHIEARRVGKQVLSMIEAVTLLHQFDRRPTADGRLIATLDDYAIAARMLRGPLGESLGVRAGPTNLHRALVRAFPDQQTVFSTAQVQKLSKAGERTVRGYLTELADHECLLLLREAKGPHPAWWQLTGKNPEDAVLPPVADLT